MMEVCWPAAAKTTCSVWTCLSEALTHCCPCVPAQFLHHLRMYVKVEAPGSTDEDIRCIPSVSLESMLGRKERAEFSNHYHPRAWLHSASIIYIHGSLPSAILENVYKATKVNNANVSSCLGGCDLLEMRRTAPIKIPRYIKEEIKHSVHAFQFGKV